MSWQQWALVAWFVWLTVGIVRIIGEQRKPVEPKVAAIVVLINLGLIALVVTA